MLRLHFSSDDLARIRVAAEPDPLWEGVLSLNLLGNRDGAVVFDHWRAQARTVMHAWPCWMPRLLRWLAPPRGDFPDLLTPAEAREGLDAGIEAVLATPHRQLRAELGRLGPLPGWAHPLMHGEREALEVLGKVLGAYHRDVLAPYSDRVQAAVQADCCARARDFLAGGADGLLGGFRPLLRWRPPVLEADYPEDRDVQLNGRGLLLIPSVYCWRKPVTLIDPQLPPVLVYPVSRPPGWWGTPAPHHGRDGLAALLGASRAEVLRAVADGCTTSEVACRVGVSPATASHHIGVLKEANLAVSLREAARVLHSLTPLGRALLEQNSP